MSADGATVYAVALGWPDSDVLTVRAPAAAAVAGTTKMRMLGIPKGGELSFQKNGHGDLEIKFPSMSFVRKECGPGCDWGYVVAMTGLQMTDDQIVPNVVVVNDN